MSEIRIDEGDREGSGGTSLSSGTETQQLFRQFVVSLLQSGRSKPTYQQRLEMSLTVSPSVRFFPLGTETNQLST